MHSRSRLAIVFALVGLLVVGASGSAVTDGQARIASSVAFPVDVAFRTDGSLVYAELNAGNVKTLPDENAAPTLLAHVPASPGGNGGFTGIAPDPADAHTIYVVYSVDNASAPHGKVNRVSKLVDGTETILFDSIPWADFHVGGRIAVGPDGLLYVSTGDNGGPTGEDYTRLPGHYPGDPAQDPRSLVGKILRFTKTGAAAGGVSGWDPYVYAMGFRNVFGLAFGPDAKLYASENGIGHDEVNVIVQGANYGWPECEGDCAGYQKPLTTFADSFGTTGIAYLGGKLYMGDFNGGRVRVIDPAKGSASIGWAAGSGNALGVAAGRDGCLYVTNTNAIFQVDVAGTARCGIGPAPTPTTTTTTPPPTITTTSTTPVTTTPSTPSTTSPTAPVASTPSTTTSTPAGPPSTSTPSPPPTTTTPAVSESVATATAPPPTNATTQESVSPPPPPSPTPAPGPAVLLLAATATAGALVLARKQRGP